MLLAAFGGGFLEVLDRPADAPAKVRQAVRAEHQDNDGQDDEQLGKA